MKLGKIHRACVACTWRRWAGCLLLACLSLAVASAARAAEALVRTRLATTGEIWVGQRVTIVIELLSPGFFAGSPAFDLPRVSGVVICPPDERPVLGTETVGGASYTVQRHDFEVFAQRPGRVEIPPWPVRFATRQGAAPPAEQRFLTDPVAFDVLLPPGAEGLITLISARELQATETWKPEPASAKVGDAFTRTLLFSARDVPAMLFPAVPAGKVDGLGVYPKTPSLRDLKERGEQRGERTETITYICERAGRAKIPGLRLSWWDVDDRELKVVEFAVREFAVASHPGMAVAPAAAPRDWRRTARTAAPCTLAGLALVMGAWRTRRRWPGWRRRTVAYWSPLHLQPLNPTHRRMS
jgi:hypothetical protein